MGLRSVNYSQLPFFRKVTATSAGTPPPSKKATNTYILEVCHADGSLVKILHNSFRALHTTWLVDRDVGNVSTPIIIERALDDDLSFHVTHELCQEVPARERRKERQVFWRSLSRAHSLCEILTDFFLGAIPPPKKEKKTDHLRKLDHNSFMTTISEIYPSYFHVNECLRTSFW